MIYVNFCFHKFKMRSESDVSCNQEVTRAESSMLLIVKLSAVEIRRPLKLQEFTKHRVIRDKHCYKQKVSPSIAAYAS